MLAPGRKNNDTADRGAPAPARQALGLRNSTVAHHRPLLDRSARSVGDSVPVNRRERICNSQIRGWILAWILPCLFDRTGRSGFPVVEASSRCAASGNHVPNQATKTAGAPSRRIFCIPADRRWWRRRRWHMQLGWRRQHDGTGRPLVTGHSCVPCTLQDNGLHEPKD
jgi:hypothetical protein